MGEDVIRLQSEPIRIDELIGAVSGETVGAIASFVGTVRNHNLGRRVERLEYHAYPEMALAELHKISDTARRRFGIVSVAVVHRVGPLQIGDAAVAIAVGSAHRDAGLQACRFVIDSLKRSVPIWKKEFFEGGEEWIEGPGSPAEPA